MPGQHRRPLSAIVPAAGEGKRMRSGTPKMLHPLCGRPLVLHALDQLAALPLDRIVVVVGHGAEDVAKTVQEQLVTDVPVEFIEQSVQRGTGDAVAVGLTANAFDLDGEDDVIVVFGDAPLLRAETLAMLATEHRLGDAAATMLTARFADPSSYGRVVRDPNGHVERIVEEPDATPDELAIDEVNPSIYCFRRGLLAPALRRLVPENAQGEYYLTDVIAVLRQAGHVVDAIEVDDPMEVVQVNDRAQLAVAEAELRARINDRWMRAGVTMVDPERTYIDTSVELEPEVRLLPNTMLQGHSVVHRGAVIGPDVQLVDTVVGRDSVVRQTTAFECEIGERVTCGPYVSLRPGTRVADDAHLGTFVEIKNSEIGAGAKVPHLSYVGDAEVGERTNIGAGNITANFDGYRKHRTKIGKDVHTGSNTVFVAPVDVGDGAWTGAGAVVNRDVPSGAMAKGVPARIEEDWAAERDNDGTGQGGEGA
ncbi:MAG TPA: bifunctional UDP-N-acetylglucosamine diphosphorylase/glucosamine-1-phosphate N-acetyltransferase GlmU [Acidimicrobiia bacterium]|nr:bifunctional UDP-N-acetylglucosamine diphosphorylase/glucosamine-1-phosphate N-acetyltransferase GlmU [Acidimicrobiia bacterium]